MVITCLTALHKPIRRAILGSPGFLKSQALALNTSPLFTYLQAIKNHQQKLSNFLKTKFVDSKPFVRACLWDTQYLNHFQMI